MRTMNPDSFRGYGPVGTNSPAKPKAPETREAWAVVDNGGINIRSVSPTRRAALVNWLVTERQLQATIFATDEDIERTWEANKGSAEATKVAVTALQ